MSEEKTKAEDPVDFESVQRCPKCGTDRWRGHGEPGFFELRIGMWVSALPGLEGLCRPVTLRVACPTCGWAWLEWPVDHKRSANPLLPDRVWVERGTERYELTQNDFFEIASALVHRDPFSTPIETFRAMVKPEKKDDGCRSGGAK